MNLHCERTCKQSYNNKQKYVVPLRIALRLFIARSDSKQTTFTPIVYLLYRKRKKKWNLYYYPHEIYNKLTLK